MTSPLPLAQLPTPLPAALPPPALSTDGADPPDIGAPQQNTPRMRGHKRKLSKRQKAAVIVRLLLNEGAELSLRDLPDKMQADLTQAMADMRYIDRDTLSAVVAEFAGELEDIGLSFPDGIAGALNALDGRISPLTAARLRREAGVRQAGDPWDQIRQLDSALLRPVMEQESTEVAAVILSKLDVSKAAELLNTLPGETARRITYAISLTGAVTPEAVDRIGLSMAAQLNDRPERAFEDEPVARIGAILNRSATQTRDGVLEALEETDSQFARKLRDAIFTFANIPDRIEARDIPAITRTAGQVELVTALGAAKSGANARARDFILDNMSNRMADQLRDEIKDLGKIREKDGEAAMNAMITTIRDMESNGDIDLIFADDEDVQQ